MAEPLQPSLHGALSDLTRWLDAERIPSTIIGGVAASALGRPRLTKDIDALAIVPEEGWAKAIQSASRHGIVPRIEGALEFAQQRTSKTYGDCLQQTRMPTSKRLAVG